MAFSSLLRRLKTSSPSKKTDARGRREQAQDRPRHRGLATAGLADQPKGLALADGEADAVDRLDPRRHPLKDAGADREIGLEILDDQEIFLCYVDLNLTYGLSQPLVYAYRSMLMTS